ncbi:MAG: MopE-related protein [bacterium]|nr:MopE-related protein [bacterium]
MIGTRLLRVVVGMGFLGACAPQFDLDHEYLPCGEDGSCAADFQCAVLDIGRVCLTLAQYTEQCVPETCNGRDDNCDGDVDERYLDLGTACTAGVGACVRDGALQCMPDELGTQCSAIAAPPVEEVCDGADNDCDGATDEELARLATGADEGECEQQVMECTDGRLSVVQSPRAPKSEECDLLDNDCDGATDEDFYPPLDEVCAIGIGECEREGANICTPDARSSMCSASPGAPTLDICDGLDNDCDGETDQIFVVSMGLGEPCTEGLGECLHSDVRVCSRDGFSTVCGADPGELVSEVCDGLDNDCNGVPDDGLESCCMPGDSQYCSTNVGACEFGTQVCAPDRTWGPCTGLLPSDEVCDGKDNDCNGVPDDGVPDCCEPDDRTSCSTDEGACVAGEQRCGDGRTWGPCLTAAGALATLPQPDLCDGLDNDCNSMTDEGFPGVRITACSVGIGPCRRDGVMDCRADGFGLACDVVPGEPYTEVCDGEDNDCDGVADNDLGEDCCTPETVRGCSLDIGECRAGTQACGADRAWGACSGREADSEACDGLDNDCDGRTDEELLDCCEPGQRLSCSTDEGTCAAGEQRCDGDHAWGPCLTAAGALATLPVPDRCDGADNDCDGETDESFAGLDQMCIIGQGACAASGLRICAEGGDAATCGVTPGNAVPEICDAADNDCDGHTDEPWDTLLGERCAVGIGACARSDAWACAPDASEARCPVEPGDPTPEECDGRDDDCNGVPDDRIPLIACYPGPEETMDIGECHTGVTLCANSTEACVGAILPSAERCDGLDQNCDGAEDATVDGRGDIYPLMQPCYSNDPITIGLGSCVEGASTCTDGRWGPCVGEVTPWGVPANCGSCAGMQELGIMTSGVHPIVIGREVTDVFCDMETDGGGWTLVLAYARAAGENDPLVIGTPPLDPATGYSNFSTAQLQGFPWEELRFFCTSSAHARTLHFKTQQAGAVAYVKGIAMNEAAYWNTDFFPFPEHTANVPAQANLASNEDAASGLRLPMRPFYRPGFQWTLRANDNEWECDDAAASAVNATYHSVWVR